MVNSKKPKRKPQITIQLQDKEGNRLYTAADMGWGDPHWARIKSEAVIGAVLHIEPPSGVMIKIRYSKEVAFTKFIERVFKKHETPANYLVVRTEAEEGEGIDSWFFIHGVEAALVKNKIKHYSDMTPMVVTSDMLENELKRLFDHNLHPQSVRIRRFDASRTTIHCLRLYRMQHLVEMARHGEDHGLTNGMPTMVDFERRLASYIKHDRPFIFNMKIRDVFLLLAELEKKNLLTRSETVEVIKKLVGGEEWKLIDLYRGLPKAGAERDKEDGGFIVKEGKHSAISIIMRKLSEWEFPKWPEAKPGEEYFE